MTLQELSKFEIVSRGKLRATRNALDTQKIGDQTIIVTKTITENFQLPVAVWDALVALPEFKTAYDQLQDIRATKKTLKEQQEADKKNRIVQEAFASVRTASEIVRQING